MFSANAFVSVAVPYSSVPQRYSVLYPAEREYLYWSTLVLSFHEKEHCCEGHLAKISADRTDPIMLPKWGMLFTYGKAEVIITLRLPAMGNL